MNINVIIFLFSGNVKRDANDSILNIRVMYWIFVLGYGEKAQHLGTKKWLFINRWNREENVYFLRNTATTVNQQLNPTRGNFIYLYNTYLFRIFCYITYYIPIIVF